MHLPSIQDVEQAASRIYDLAVRTPLKPSISLSARSRREAFLKLETVQPSGSFKIRGVANFISQLLESDDRPTMLVTASAGNHGRAVAYVANQVGLSAVIFVGAGVPEAKVMRIRALNAEVRRSNWDLDEATQEAIEFANVHGGVFIHAFDDAGVVAGQGTIGLEILEALPRVDTIIAPVSGGGLIAGIALAVKSRKPEIRVIGVSMARGAAMIASLRAGRPMWVAEEETLADCLRGGIGLQNQMTFELVRTLVDDVHAVSEDSIAEAMAHALLEERLVLEGGAACSLVPLLEGWELPGETVVAICSGDNVDMAQLLAVTRRRIDG